MALQAHIQAPGSLARRLAPSQLGCSQEAATSLRTILHLKLCCCSKVSSSTAMLKMAIGLVHHASLSTTPARQHTPDDSALPHQHTLSVSVTHTTGTP